MIVYLFGKSPFENKNMETFMNIIETQSRSKKDVRVVFMHGGVLIARKNNQLEQRLKKLVKSGAKVYFRREDLEARAISDNSRNTIGFPIDTTEIMKLAADPNTLVSFL